MSRFTSADLGLPSGVYKIVSACDGTSVITLKDGIPMGIVIVEKPKQPLADFQMWSVIHQSDGIVTFKSRTEAGNEDSRKPYAQNLVDYRTDPRIRGDIISTLAAYRIRPTDVAGVSGVFTIGLPEWDPLMVWTIDDDEDKEYNGNIILSEYKEDNKKQQWIFQVIGP